MTESQKELTSIKLASVEDHLLVLQAYMEA